MGADQAEADKLVRWCLEWLLARGACRAIVYRIGEVAPALRVQQQRTGPRLEFREGGCFVCASVSLSAFSPTGIYI